MAKSQSQSKSYKSRREIAVSRVKTPGGETVTMIAVYDPDDTESCFTTMSLETWLAQLDEVLEDYEGMDTHHVRAIQVLQQIAIMATQGEQKKTA